MSALRSYTVVCPTLIGRESEFALLTDLLKQASSGQGNIVLIAGEAGVGKSRLIAAIRECAGAAGGQIVQGCCFEQDRALPYAPLIDLLRSLTANRPAHKLERMLGPAAAELIKIAPDLAGALPHITPTPALEPEQEKHRLSLACTQLVRRLIAAAPPLLLIIEDLHWCDDTSLEWLLAFARELATQPLLLLLTYRDDETHPALDRLLAALNRLPLVSELALLRLTYANVRSMLHTILELTEPPRANFLEAIYTLTDGNPLFIEEVLKALITAGDIYREGGVWTRKPLRELQIPRTVQLGVQQRTRHLSAPARTLLALAAVAGQRFDFTVLQAVTQQSEVELLRQIKDLVTAELVVEESDETFAFRHALTRQAIYAGLLARQRKALHRAVAEALARCYADALDARAGELAYHWYEAGLWAPGLEWGLRAGDSATRLYAHSEALQHYTRARQCAEKLGQPERVAAVDQASGQVYQARGEFPQALACFERALEATREPAQRAALKGSIGLALLSLADARTPAVLHEALRELNPATQASEIASATLCLGRHYNYLGQYTRGLGYLEEARRLSEPLDDPTTLRFIYAFISEALLSAGRIEESKDIAERCVALGEARQDARTLALGHWNLTESSLRLGHWQNITALAGRGRQFAQHAGWLNLAVWNTIQCAEVAYHQGELSVSAQLADEAAALAVELQGRRVLVWVHRQRTLLKAALGAEEAAYHVGLAAVRQSDELTEVAARGWSRMALADLAMQREEWTQAAELLEQIAAMLAGTENRVMQMELGTRQASAYCAQGRLAEAWQLIADTLILVQASGARPCLALAWRVQGQILAAQGSYAAALDAFGRAIALCEAIGCRLELAGAHYQRGVLYRTLGEPAAAHADWAHAGALCAQMGARALQWRTHAALGQLALEQQQVLDAEREFTAARAIVDTLAAAMPDATFRAHLHQRAAALIPARPLMAPREAVKVEYGGLTERERTVAALIAQGYSNRAIAERLIVSESTITTHVSNIFAKLGCNTRIKVAHWAREKRLA